MGGKVPFEIPWNVNIHKGWFADTVPPFAEGLDGDDFIALLRIDSNLRSSAEEILRGLGGWIGKGTVVELTAALNFPGWREGEFAAMENFVKERGLEVTYLCYSMTSLAAIVGVRGEVTWNKETRMHDVELDFG